MVPHDEKGAFDAPQHVWMPVFSAIFQCGLVDMDGISKHLFAPIFQVFVGCKSTIIRRSSIRRFDILVSKLKCGSFGLKARDLQFQALNFSFGVKSAILLRLRQTLPSVYFFNILGRLFTEERYFRL